MCSHVWQPPAWSSQFAHHSDGLSPRPPADTQITEHHSVLGGTAVSTDKKHLELHLAVRVIWMPHELHTRPALSLTSS